MAARPNTDRHIAIDEKGRPHLAGTRMRVAQIVAERWAYGWSAEEIHLQHERRFSLAQIHAALAYYYDNQAEMDAQMAQEDAEVERLRAATPVPPFVERMRSEGRLR